MVEPQNKTNHAATLVIAEGRSRFEKEWHSRERSWGDLVEKLKNPRVTGETFDQYKQMAKADKDAAKDVGGFVGGPLKGGRRAKGSVAYRTLLTLDADHIKGDLWASVESMLDCACVGYSTHSHSPAAPRMRLVIPFSKPVPADQYEPIARRIAADLGIDFFDDLTYETHRLMYWPSVASDGEYMFRQLEGPFLDPEEVLARYAAKGQNWADPFHWPYSTRETVKRKKDRERQGDPLTKPGLIGAFNRAFTVAEAIEKFIPERYRQESDGRWTYTEGSTFGGLVLYDDDTFAYSHHATDPAAGMNCNAFDLVRLHLFGELDLDAKPGTAINKLPSYMEMTQLAGKDPKVRSEAVKAQATDAAEDFDGVEVEGEEQDWRSLLLINKKGEIINNVTNYVTIIRKDPLLQGLAYNEHREGVEFMGDPPWKQVKPGWNKPDDANLGHYLDSRYGLWAPEKRREAVLVAAMERAFHPIRDYLTNLPAWDGVERLDTLLIDKLQADNNAYVRAVTRKTLVAAVARIFEPGVKFDEMLVLVGMQGIGKSTIFRELGGPWFNDSLSISDMRDKTAAEKLQGYWIIEVGELAGLKKMDVETVKGFLSRQDDIYRASYGAKAENHPRQCIIVGSTNTETGFLRDVTGNRRFWPVKLHKKDQYVRSLKRSEIDQIWAEAFMWYTLGESVLLEGEAKIVAAQAQVDNLEVDEREGLVMEFLDRRLPENWDETCLADRRAYWRGDDFMSGVAGTVERRFVCTLEIWCELFGRDQAGMKKQDSYDIANIMNRIPGWSCQTEARKRLPIYGRQRIYMRD